MQNASTITTTITSGGTINSTIVSSSVITSTVTPGGVGPAGANGTNGTNGAAGPNTVTSATTTNLTGILKGNGSVVGTAVADTDYQNPLTLTTTGSSGAATLSGDTLNIPQYSGGASGTVTSINVSGGTTGLTTSGGPVTTSGVVTIAGTLGVGNGGTGSTTQNFVDLTTNQTAAGNKTFSGTTALTNATTVTNSNATNGLTVTQSGNVGTSDSSGGALLVKDTGNTGYGVNIYTQTTAPGERFRIFKDAAHSTTGTGSQTLTSASTSYTVGSTTGFPSSGVVLVENSTSIGENNNTIFLTYTSVTSTTFVGSAGTFYPGSSITLVNLAVVKQVDTTDTHYSLHIIDYSNQFSNAKIKITSGHPDVEYAALGYNNSIGQGQFGQDIPVASGNNITATDVWRFLGRNDANTGFNPAMIYTRPGVTQEGLIGIGFQSLSSPTAVAAHLHIKNDTNFGDTNAAALIGQIIQGAASQTANLLELRADGSTTPLASFGAAGALTVPGVTVTDATNIVVGTTTGTQIGTSTSQKLGFYGATPVVRPSGDISTALGNLGLVASGTISVADISATGTPSATTYLRGDGSWSTPSGSGGGITRTVSSISTPTTAGGSASTDYVYFVSGTTTLTLPTAVSNTNRYTVKNTGANTVTVATTSSQTIDGSTTVTLPVANTSLDLISDGSNWRII